MFQIWFGGASSPARLVAPIAMLLGVAAARIFHTTKTSSGRSVELLALGVSVVIAAALGVDRGRLLFNARDGVALWLEWSNDLIDLPRALPSLFRDTPGQAWLKAGIWGACFAGAWLAQTAFERRSHCECRFGRSVVSVLALDLVPRDGDHARADARMAGWSCVADHTGDRRARTAAQRVTIASAGFRVRRDACRLVFGTALADPNRNRSTATQYARRIAPVGPGCSGRHLSGRRRRSGTWPRNIRDAIGLDVAGPLDCSVPEADVAQVAPVPSSIRLPVAVGSLTIETGAPSVGAIPSVELKPAGAGRRFTFVRPVMRGIAHRAVSYGPTRAFFMDDYAYAETSGFWVAGQRGAQVVLSTDSLSQRRRLYVRNIPFQNHLSISIAGERHEISLNPHEETEIELPPTALDLVLRVETDAGVRPSQLDPDSIDFRFLGCWVEIR